MFEGFDLLEFVSFLKGRRKLILVVTCVGFLFTTVEVFLKPNEFLCKTVMIPEDSGNGGVSGSLASIAGIAGFNLGGLSGSKGAITPDLYPEIIKSTPFFWELDKQRFEIPSTHGEMTIREFLREEKSFSIVQSLIGLPFKLIDLFKGQDEPQSRSEDGQAARLTKEDLKLKALLNQRIRTNVDIQSGVIEITVELNNPYLATQVASFAMEYIKQYTTDYRISREKENLEFVEKSYAQAELKFKQSQAALSAFQDQNQNLSTSKSRSQERYMESLYSLNFEVYNTLAQQLESSKIKLQETKPVFKVIEPPVVPTLKSGPRRLLLIGVFTTLAFVLSIGFEAFRFMLFAKSQKG